MTSGFGTAFGLGVAVSLNGAGFTTCIERARAALTGICRLVAKTGIGTGVGRIARRSISDRQISVVDAATAHHELE